MKKFAGVVATLFALGLAAAYAAPQGKAAKAAGKTHQVACEVVSVDATAKTLTIKTESGQTSTLPVEGTALKRLANLKAGEKITATCRDNEKGEHQAIVGFRPAAAKK
jgi:Cu/Ag efflux protein CusF